MEDTSHLIVSVPHINVSENKPYLKILQLFLNMVKVGHIIQYEYYFYVLKDKWSSLMVYDSISSVTAKVQFMWGLLCYNNKADGLSLCVLDTFRDRSVVFQS